jgi:hypothetical protein
MGFLFSRTENGTIGWKTCGKIHDVVVVSNKAHSKGEKDDTNEKVE